MNNVLKYLLLASIPFLLAGCVSVGLPQYKAITQSIAPKTTELDKFFWSLSFGEYQTQVLAVTLDAGTGFTSKRGDALMFTGENIALIAAIDGQNKVLSIEEKSTNGTSVSETDAQIIKQVLLDGQLFETITCAPVQRTIQQRVFQRCQGEFEYTTQITYQNGQIIKIEQDIPFYNKTLILTK